MVFHSYVSHSHEISHLHILRQASVATVAPNRPWLQIDGDSLCLIWCLLVVVMAGLPHFTIISWLVVYLPLGKILVNWDDYYQYMGK